MSGLPAAVAGAANKKASSDLAKAAAQSSSPADIAEKGIASIEPAKGTLGIASGLAKAGMLDSEGGLARIFKHSCWRGRFICSFRFVSRQILVLMKTIQQKYHLAALKGLQD